MDLILKPRPGGKSWGGWIRFSCICNVKMVFRTYCLSLAAIYSGERILGPLQRGVGKDPGPRGSAEKTAQQALRGGAAVARPINVWQKEHSHCIWTGWFFLIKLFKVV